MKRNIFSQGRGLLLMFIMVAFLMGMVGETTAAPNFKGKVIVLVVPTSAGGGTDINGRLISRYLGKFIPGNPTIVIRNMPGAGGLIGANLANAARPDGLTILVTIAGTITQNITRPRGADFKLQEMHPIYAQPEGCVYYIKPGLIKEPKEILTAKGLIFGHNVATGAISSVFIWAKELLGFDCKMVLGYAGSGPARLAFLAGETNFTGGGTAGHSVWKTLVDRGEVVTIFQAGILDPSGNIVREKVVPNIPTIAEFYRQIYGKAPSGPVWEVYKLLMGTRTFSQTLLLPPKTPAEMVNICRKAAIDMVKDPKFLDDAEKLAPGGSHLLGEELARIFPAGVSGNPETVKFMKDFFMEKYGVVFE